jgi:hypothetical protein
MYKKFIKPFLGVYRVMKALALILYSGLSQT